MAPKREYLLSADVVGCCLDVGLATLEALVTHRLPEQGSQGRWTLTIGEPLCPLGVALRRSRRNADPNGQVSESGYCAAVPHLLTGVEDRERASLHPGRLG